MCVLVDYGLKFDCGVQALFLFSVMPKVLQHIIIS